MSSQRIAVVTDSSAYIPEEALGDLSVPVIPLWLHWGDERFRDGVDIDPPTFYRRLRTDKTFPTTSQPSAGEFESFFRQVGAEADAVVGVFISSKLSGTVPNAQAAQAQLPDLTIRIVDSLSTSMGLGFSVLAAARAAATGKSLDEVVAAAEEMRDRMQVLFAVDTLEYLHRGGRIGAAAKLFGSALNLKLVLEVRDGTITPVARIRTRRKALDKLYELVEEQVTEGARVHMAVLHVAAPEEAARVREQLETRFHPVEMVASECGPVVGAHAGPGTVGVAFYVE